MAFKSSNKQRANVYDEKFSSASNSGNYIDLVGLEVERHNPHVLLYLLKEFPTFRPDEFSM